MLRVASRPRPVRRPHLGLRGVPSQPRSTHCRPTAIAAVSGQPDHERVLRNTKLGPHLLGFALPNFYFHLSAVYMILRHNGVELGKRDFLGVPNPR